MRLLLSRGLATTSRTPGGCRTSIARLPAYLRIALCTLLATLLSSAWSQPVEPAWSLVQKEKPALLATLQELVEIESGSLDIEGLDRLAKLIAGKLAKLGAQVEIVHPGPDTNRMRDTPEQIGKMVKATFSGTGAKRILLLAHMDTVYPPGWLAQQPFKIKGDRAWGLGIADAKHGIAVILHSLAILKAMNFRQYGSVTVFINGDEEIGSPASRNAITRLGAENDAVMSFENGGYARDRLALSTSGVATATLTVQGRAAQSFIPQRGVNALYELAHQMLQTRELSKPAVGLQVTWTMANAGIVRNMIPPSARAEADIRVRRVSEYEGIEQKLRDSIQNKLLPEAQVELEFERRRPPLEPTDASRALAGHAQQIYREIGKELFIQDMPGGTDAAYAALKSTAPVIEGFALHGFGAHSTNAEHILLASIEPRLYLTTRMIMDIATGKAPLAATPQKN